ncbi:hypothetical protein E2C01_084101 [Portunus trituberculatus]|uniref:Uncharacterized protein n=1 Tax=Portunus trituberculatus TaxID=210409 RepID=A0A5B7J5E4_PORTR|nr:hypothetical protein [Portunus trituberculatus]
MAGVLGNFMRHSRARSEMQRRREALKAEREVSGCLKRGEEQVTKSRDVLSHNFVWRSL